MPYRISASGRIWISRTSKPKRSPPPLVRGMIGQPFIVRGGKPGIHVSLEASVILGTDKRDRVALAHYLASRATMNPPLYWARGGLIAQWRGKQHDCLVNA